MGRLRGACKIGRGLVVFVVLVSAFLRDGSDLTTTHWLRGDSTLAWNLWRFGLELMALWFITLGALASQLIAYPVRF